MKQVGFAVVFSGPQQSLGNKNSQTPQWKYPESMNQKGEQKHKDKQPNSTPLSSCFSYPPKKENPLENSKQWKQEIQLSSHSDQPRSHSSTPPEFNIDTVGIPKIHQKTIQTIIFWGCNPIVAKQSMCCKIHLNKNHHVLLIFCYRFLKLLGV